MKPRSRQEPGRLENEEAGGIGPMRTPVAAGTAKTQFHQICTHRLMALGNDLPPAVAHLTWEPVPPIRRWATGLGPDWCRGGA